MSGKNKNNSIIFLTTLSVYLGLVLVGATPSVLAQVENSQRKFEVSPIDLTNAEAKKFVGYGYAEKLIEFAESTFVRIEILKITSPNEILDERFYAKTITFSPCFDEEDKKLLESCYIDGDNNVEWSSAAQAGIMADISLEILDPFSDVSKRKTEKSVFQNSIEIILDNSKYKCELVIEKSSNQKAENLANQLKLAVDNLASVSKISSLKQIYENTKVTSENNQVIIVTRLPRGSLDELLKQDAKAESK